MNLKVNLLSLIALGATVSFSFIGRTYAEPRVAFAEKGRLVLSDDFSQAPSDHKVRDISESWQRKLSFGRWTSGASGGVKVEYVPKQGHGPVLTYLGSAKDVIIECEFRLPRDAVPNRHFRIFLDHPDYRGHTIAAWANVSSVFQPEGLTLLHNPKTKDKKVIEEARFGPVALKLKPGKWHKIRLELVGKRARVTIGDTVVEGEHPSLKTTKIKIGLNPGKAGGELRNFRVWEVKPKNQ